jgi:hypothetical protein
MSQHPSYRGRLSRSAETAAAKSAVDAAPWSPPARRYADRACCCPAAPTVTVIMPAAHGRQADTDLLLCGHHYRVSKTALANARARVLDMQGSPLTADEWPDPA